MPKRSDCPYPEVVYSQIHDATTFERYQTFNGTDGAGTDALCGIRHNVLRLDAQEQ